MVLLFRERLKLRSKAADTDPKPEVFPAEQTCQALVLALLIVKVTVSGWNALLTHGRTYDRADHLFRAKNSLLTLGGHSYDPPLYYLPTAALRWLSERPPSNEDLLRVLRLENWILLVLGYLCWLYVTIPRLFPDWRQRTVASLVLLALPTYQKIVQAAHPDNLHFGLASISFAFWIWLWSKRNDPVSSSRFFQQLVALAVLIGLTGMTRPFAAVSVAVCWTAAMTLIWVRPEPKRWLKWRNAVALTLIAGSLSTSWFVYRLAETGMVSGSYNPGYVRKYAPHRKDFPFVSYFTTFYFKELLKEPNRDMINLEKDNRNKFRNKYGNSFPTLAYSELWGDHWKYFSGKPSRKDTWSEEEKRWPKRIVFTLALPLTLFLFLRFVPSLVYVTRQARSNWREVFPSVLLVTYLLLGSALFLFWQTGSGLSPGKNSAVKAIYNAHLIAPLVLVPLLWPMSSFTLRLGVFWTTLVCLVSVPMITFWPAW